MVDDSETAVIVARRDGRMEWLSRAATELLHRYFPRCDNHLPDALYVRPRAATARGSAPAANREPAQYKLSLGGVALVVREVPLGSRLLLTIDERSGGRAAAAQRPFGLTRREAEILNWVTLGKTNAEVAAILGSRPLTIKKHLEHIYTKLDVRSRTAATALMLRGASRQAPTVPPQT